MSLRRWMWVIFSFLGVLPALAEEVPFASSAAPSERLRADETWRTLAARAALDQGFPRLALRILRESESVGSELQLLQVSALLATGAFEKVSRIFDEPDLPDTAEWELRRGLWAYFEGGRDEAREILGTLAPEDLSAADRAWFFLLDALLFAYEGNLPRASASFRRAAVQAPTPALATHFEIIRLREELLRQPVREESISELRAVERSMRGQRGGFEAARLLAIALYRTDRAADAGDVIERQLRTPGVEESGLRPTFLLLLGVIAGEDSGRGRLALRQLVSLDGDRMMREQALRLLARGPIGGDERPEFMEFLSGLLRDQPQHDLRESMLGLRGLLHALRGDFSAAELDARAILDEFPGSPLVGDALRLLAYLNWSRDPPRFRTAADYLNRLRALVPDDVEQARLEALMGDSFFLNRDYANAVELYASAFPLLSSDEQALVLSPWLEALLRLQDFNEAEVLLSESRLNPSLSEEQRWRLEWNALDSLRAGGEATRALERAHAVLTEDGAVLTPGLAVRFMWARARLALEAGIADEVPILAEELLAFISESPPEAFVEVSRDELASFTLLLKGEAFYALGQADAGLAVFEDLRERFPTSGAVILSVLITARDFGQMDRLDRAQQLLVGLADQFPGSESAPIALWEAALTSERQGLPSNFRDAISILELIVERYPNHPLAFHARLRQADLSRRLNDFSTALLLYDRMRRIYPDHPERFRIDLSRADTLLARGSTDRNSLEDAAGLYEELFLATGLSEDVRVEAGFKAGLALRLLGRSDQAMLLWWHLYTAFDPALVRDIPHLEAQGRYWLARTVFELAAAFEADGHADQAQALYNFILDAPLPGTALARARLNPRQDVE